MKEKTLSQEFKLKNIEEIKNCFIKDIDHSTFMRQKHKKDCLIKNTLKITYASFYSYLMCFCFCFRFLVGTPIRITSSAIGLKICAITASIRKYKLIIKKAKNNYDGIVLLAKSMLNSIEVLIFKSLIN